MELKEFLHMNDGDGELSYSQNSFLQGVSLMRQPILESAVQSLITQAHGGPFKVLKVADLGCGVGPVPLGLPSLVREIVGKKCRELNWEDDQVPEIEIYFNDLPSNDFNLLFRDLKTMNLPNKSGSNDIPLCFIMATPGSYYDRLFSRNTLHLVHANYTLHWLSQAPPGLYSQEGDPINKGNIYISETSPKIVAKAYLAQFQQDFTQFLKCRSQELVSNGLMLLTFRGRPSSSNAETTWQPWELKIFTDAFACLVSQGLIKEEKLDSFDFPYYGACKEEIQGVVEMEGSFTIETMKTMAHPVAYEIEDIRKRADTIGKFMRAFSEPLVSSHFGHEVLDPLYDKITLLVFEHLADHKPADHCTIIVLLRKN